MFTRQLRIHLLKLVGATLIGVVFPLVSYGTSAYATSLPAPPTSSQIVFGIGQTDGVNPDGSGLVNFGANLWGYQISPDGTQAAYSDGRNICIVKANNPSAGCEFSPTLNYGLHALNSESPVWSPDGSKIMFTAQVEDANGGPFAVYIMNSDGSNLHRVYYDVNGVFGASWSPDGTKLLISGADLAGDPDWSLAVIDLNGNIQQQFSATGEEWETPSWSPDGTQIAFTRYIDSTQQEMIDTINVDGTGRQDIYVADANDAPNGNLVWSPNSDQLVFMLVHSIDGDADLATIPANGLGSPTIVVHGQPGNYDMGPTQWWQPSAAPATFTSAGTFVAIVGQTVSASNFLVTTSGSPSPSLVVTSGTLPNGISFVDNGNGTGYFSGTAIAGTANAYPITITASNSGGYTPQAFTLIVVNPLSIQVPANITALATGTSGAIVTYPEPTTSGGYGTISTSCSQASGATFANGATTVTCTASDSLGEQTAPTSFTVTVQSAQTQAQNLMAYIVTNNVGPGGSLQAKLQKVINDLAANPVNDSTVDTDLAKFTKAVNNDAGKQITDAQATILLQDATAVQTAITQ